MLILGVEFYNIYSVTSGCFMGFPKLTNDSITVGSETWEMMEFLQVRETQHMTWLASCNYLQAAYGNDISETGTT
jgi:hypothetical protein